MGSFIELNDTLQLTAEQGFPTDVFNYEDHQKNPVTLEDVKGKIFSFKNKPKARIFQLDPVRVYFVQNIDGKWLFWGRIVIESETISKVLDKDGEWNGEWETSGTYSFLTVYDPEYQNTFTLNEAPEGRNFLKL